MKSKNKKQSIKNFKVVFSNHRKRLIHMLYCHVIPDLKDKGKFNFRGEKTIEVECKLTGARVKTVLKRATPCGTFIDIDED